MADFRSFCPKCKSKNINLYKDKKFRWGGPTDGGLLVLHCYVCGHELCGEKAQEEVDKQHAIWEEEEAKPKLPDPVALAKKAAEEEKWRLIRIHRAKEAETKRIEMEKAEQARAAEAKKWHEARKLAWDAEVRASDAAWQAAHAGVQKAPVQPVQKAPHAQPAAPQVLERESDRLRREAEVISLIASGLGKSVSSISMCSRDVRAAAKTFEAVGQAFLDAENAVTADVKRVGDIYLTISSSKTPDDARTLRTELLALVAGLPAKVTTAIQAARAEGSSTVRACAYEGCANPAAENSKYCSSKCKDKNGRLGMKARALAAAQALQPTTQAEPPALVILEPVVIEPVATPVVIEPVAIPIVIEPVVTGTPTTAVCVFAGCGKEAAKGSKYCSRSCKDKQSNYNIKMRKLAEAATEEAPTIEVVTPVPEEALPPVVATPPVIEVIAPVIEEAPLVIEAPVVKETSAYGPCAYPGCGNMGTKYSKFCSKTCKDKDARRPRTLVRVPVPRISAKVAPPPVVATPVVEVAPTSQVAANKVPYRVVPPVTEWDRWNQMDEAGLSQTVLADLRKYAAYGLGIKGACKLIGGKAELVRKCLEIRQQRAS